MIVGLAGLGAWGTNIRRTLLEFDDVELLCYDPEHKSDVDSFGSLCELAEVVVIAAPSDQHFELAMDALERRRPVFVEKPLAMCAADAEQLTVKADEYGQSVMVGHLMLYSPAFQWVRQYVQAGGIGKVLYAYSQRTNLGKQRTHEDALWSLGPHDVSMFLALLGASKSAKTYGHAYLGPVDDVCFMELEFECGASAHMHVSWLDPHKKRLLTVIGSSGMVVFDDTAERKVTVYDRDGLQFSKVWMPFVPSDEPLKREMQHFLHCCATGQKPLTDGQNGLDVVRVLEGL